MSFVAFGEVMLRLSPAEFGVKINSSKRFDVGFAGSEANVVSSLALLGNEVSFVTKFPSNQLGDAAISFLGSFGIDTAYVLRGGKRIGTYFVELGSSIRPSSVIYDRSYSAVSEIGKGEFDWEKILAGKKWIFLSGITPVLSDQCAKETILAAETARGLGVKVAFDMNYRRSLWDSPTSARQVFDKILQSTDLFFGNAGVLKDVYDIEAKGGNEIEAAHHALGIAAEKFGTGQMAFTARKHLSASSNEVAGLYYSKGETYTSDPYSVDITDRFGAGDAFAAGCLHALLKEWPEQKVIDFATAAFALKHTIRGDQHTSTEQEILSTSDGNTKGQVLR